MLPQIVLGLAVIVILAAGSVVILWVWYRQAKNRANEIEALGFRRWLDVDAHFIHSVCSLALHPYPERLGVERAFRRMLPDLQLVIFDLVEKFGYELNSRRYEFAVYLPDEDLPEFRVIPRPNEFGKGALANSAKITVKGLVKFALNRSGEKQLDFFDQPEVDGRFIVTARDEERAYSVLTAERIKRLNNFPPGVMLQAGGGVILIDRLGVRVDRRFWQGQLSELSDLANQAAQILLH